MLFVRRLLTATSLSALPAVSTLGQAAAATAAVTAAATAAGVRFTAPRDAVRVRLQVYTAGGQALFEASREGSFFDWQVQDDAGARLPEGSYLCVVTAEALSEKK